VPTFEVKVDGLGNEITVEAAVFIESEHWVTFFDSNVRETGMPVAAFPTSRVMKVVTKSTE
jgi:hypothetical protein